MLTIRTDPHAAEIRGSPPPEGDEPSLRAIGLVLHRHRLLIAATILTALALGIAYTLYSRPVYESVSVVRFEVERLEHPSPFTPLGAKGVGEGGAIPGPAAVANAVEDALAPYGVTIRALPITPERVWEWVRGEAGEA